MKEVDCVLNILNSIDRSKSGYLNKFTLSTKLNFDELINNILSTPFRVVDSNDGIYSTIEETGSKDDFSKQGSDFYYHTDGLYHNKPPEIVLMYCRKQTKFTTKTLFLDTNEILKKLNNHLDLLSSLDIVYIGRDKSLNRTRLVGLHPYDGKFHLSYGSRAYIMPNIESLQVKDVPDITKITEISQLLLTAIKELKPLVFTLNTNDVIIFDNLSFIHAREAEEVDYERKIYRLWLSKRN